nr:hypothetical protein [uncultured Marinifilum sp.]
MKKSVKIITGLLGFGMLIPGIAKFFEPFKTWIYRQVSITEMPFPEIMQYFVKFGEVGVGLALLFLVIKGDKLDDSIKRKLFYLSNLTVAIMMVVAIYVHLHPDVPAEILPMESKPPYLAIFYLILISINFYLNRKVKK